MVCDYDAFKVRFDKKHNFAHINFPLVKKMKVSMDLLGTFFMFVKVKTPGILTIRDVKMKGMLSETVTKKGYPQFIAPEFDFDIGHTKIEMTDDPEIEFFANELLHIFNAISSQATRWFGAGLVDQLIDHTAKQITNNYNYPIMLDHYGNDHWFGVDLRQTREPKWGKDYINLYFLGDLNYGFQRDTHHLPKKRKGTQYDFIEHKDAAQVIITEHTFNSMLRAMDLGKMFEITSE